LMASGRTGPCSCGQCAGNSPRWRRWKSQGQRRWSRRFAERAADVVITEYRLRWTDGLKAARSVKVRWATCPVVIFTRTGAKGLPSGR